MSMLARTAMAATLAAFALPANPARAEIQFPWCAEYSSPDGGSTNCGFYTREQCLAAISGVGGHCNENLSYPGVLEKPVRRSSPKRNMR